MKGQFLVIGALVIGAIVLSTAGLVSEVQSQRAEVPETSLLLEEVRDRASSMNMNNRRDRLLLSWMLEEEGVVYDVSYWSSQGCVNVTITDDKGIYELHCLN